MKCKRGGKCGSAFDPQMGICEKWGVRIRGRGMEILRHSLCPRLVYRFSRLKYRKGKMRVVVCPANGNLRKMGCEDKGVGRGSAASGEHSQRSGA